MEEADCAAEPGNGIWQRQWFHSEDDQDYEGEEDRLKGGEYGSGYHDACS
jgi:hypothetical protein